MRKWRSYVQQNQHPYYYYMEPVYLNSWYPLLWIPQKGGKQRWYQTRRGNPDGIEMSIQKKNSTDTLPVSSEFMKTEAHGHPQLQIPTFRVNRLESCVFLRNSFRHRQCLCAHSPYYNRYGNHASAGVYWCSLICLGKFRMEFSISQFLAIRGVQGIFNLNITQPVVNVILSLPSFSSYIPLGYQTVMGKHGTPSCYFVTGHTPCRNIWKMIALIQRWGLKDYDNQRLRFIRDYNMQKSL